MPRVITRTFTRVLYLPWNGRLWKCCRQNLNRVLMSIPKNISIFAADTSLRVTWLLDDQQVTNLQNLYRTLNESVKHYSCTNIRRKIEGEWDGKLQFWNEWVGRKIFVKHNLYFEYQRMPPLVIYINSYRHIWMRTFTLYTEAQKKRDCFKFNYMVNSENWFRGCKCKYSKAYWLVAETYIVGNLRLSLKCDTNTQICWMPWVAVTNNRHEIRIARAFHGGYGDKNQHELHSWHSQLGRIRYDSILSSE